MKSVKHGGKTYTAEAIKADADIIIRITMDEAKGMFGFYGRTMAKHLANNGFFDMCFEGKKFFYELKA